MRDTVAWRRDLTQELKRHWPAEGLSLEPATLCEVELGLYTLTQVAPDASAADLWVLLTGYPFTVMNVESWPSAQRQMLGNARYLLPFYRSDYRWQQALSRYLQIPDRLRLFDLPDVKTKPEIVPVSIASDRAKVYAKALAMPVPHRKRTTQWAAAGRYQFADNEYKANVDIPEGAVFAPPQRHNLTTRSTRRPIVVSVADLVATARWVDEQLQAAGKSGCNFTRRMERIRLEYAASDRKAFCESSTVSIDQTAHMIGMVSSGKSTLMDVLSVWAARNGMRVTLVVTDATSALNKAELFCTLGLAASPILGAHNRERHLNRLHYILSAESKDSPLLHSHMGFRWLSTVCPLDGLRDSPAPIAFGQEPCLSLQEASANKEGSGDRAPAFACPLYTKCPEHQAQIDLVNASIWIATPASLVYSRTEQQVCAEDVRFLELMCRCSDLVIIDEADRVQVQLDTMFSPSQTLVSRNPDSWLGRLWEQVVPQLNFEGRGQLRQTEVDAWCQAHETAQSATNRLFGLLLRSEVAHSWAKDGEYFTDFILLDRFAQEIRKLCNTDNRGERIHESLRRIFDAYLRDPLGDRLVSEAGNLADTDMEQVNSLKVLAQQAVLIINEQQRQQLSSRWVQSAVAPDVTLTAVQLRECATKLEMALLVSVLQNRIDALIRNWRQVDAILRLEGNSELLFQRPPDDYSALVPASPMGNVLAFQYIRPTGNSGEPGELRFFRCSGVGRWLVLNLPDLLHADGVQGPNVLLLSGTSWAGTSPAYHVQDPVTAILRAPKSEVDAIRQSRFYFKPVYDEKERKPITVSGLQGAARFEALRNMVSQLARRSGLRRLSLLEQERDRLPENRQRILLLVGSYKEAEEVYKHLCDLRPDWQGQVTYLVPDDESFESSWQSKTDKLQRGLVYRFAAGEAWILVAPLLAVERGHNILNEYDEAALGSVHFLVRPHPKPNEISHAVHSINRWAIDRYADEAWFRTQMGDSPPTWGTVGGLFRDEAYRYWRALLRTPMIYSTLSERDRDAVTWSQLVTIWQVIGRLVRGGRPAEVYFNDAAFAPKVATQDDHAGQDSASLLIGMRKLLRPYFVDGDDVSHSVFDRLLVQTLYGPFYTAIERMEGLPNV